VGTGRACLCRLHDRGICRLRGRVLRRRLPRASWPLQVEFSPKAGESGEELGICVLHAGEREVITNQRRLTAVNDSEASHRAVDGVATMMGGRRGFHVQLLHLLPPFPPELLEFGGTEDPEVEVQKEAAIRHEQAGWVEQAKQAAQPMLARVVSILRQARKQQDSGMFCGGTSQVIHRRRERPWKSCAERRGALQELYWIDTSTFLDLASFALGRRSSNTPLR
jgi:hypothetical protein